MKKPLIAVILCTCIQLAVAAGANLYQIELPADSQSDELRGELMKKGLQQVLANVSGNERIEKNPVVKAKLDKADHFVQEYSYSKDNIRIRYNKNAVLAILKKAGALKNVSTPSETVALQISNIKQGNEISALLAYFEHLENVNKVELTEIAGDVIQLLVSVQAPMETFQQSVTHQHLVFKSQTEAEHKLIYEWSR
jgi:hypothetical protein